MKYYKDNNGVVYAYENDGSQDGVIPSNLVEIAESEANLITNPAKTFAELKQMKLMEVNRAFELTMQQITSGYPASETSSWVKQESEARSYVADSAATTPLINALSLSRGISKAELVARIISKADLFANVSGTLIGRRQGLEDALNALPVTATADDVAAIVWKP